MGGQPHHLHSGQWLRECICFKQCHAHTPSLHFFRELHRKVDKPARQFLIFTRTDVERILSEFNDERKNGNRTFDIGENW